MVPPFLTPLQRQNLAALVLLLIGSLQLAGYVVRAEMLRAVGAATAVAPLPNAFADVDGAAKASPLWAKYGTRIDSESARELLAARLEPPAPPPMEHVPLPREDARRAPAPRSDPAHPTDAIGDFLRSREGKALRRKVERGLFGMLRKRL